MEPFVVKHYTSEEGPIIKGNGFDGTRIGEDREEAEAFVLWVNALIVDAERYRWLRNIADPNKTQPFIGIYQGSFTAWNGPACDEKIDAAMTAREPETKP